MGTNWRVINTGYLFDPSQKLRDCAHSKTTYFLLNSYLDAWQRLHFTKSYYLKFRHLRKEICTCFSISIFRLTRKYGFLINSLRWPLKMVRYLLDSENHANQEVQISVVTLRTLVKLPRPLRLCIYEKPPSIWKISLYRTNVFRSLITMVELVSVQRPISGVDAGSMAQKECWIFTARAQKCRE